MKYEYTDEFYIETLEVSIEAEEKALLEKDYNNAAEMFEIEETILLLRSALEQAQIDYGTAKQNKGKEKNDTITFQQTN